MADKDIKIAIIILFHMFKELSRDMKDIKTIKSNFIVFFNKLNPKRKKNKKNDSKVRHSQLPNTSNKKKILKAVKLLK